MEENNRNYFIRLLSGFRDNVRKMLSTGLASSQDSLKGHFFLLGVAHRGFYLQRVGERHYKAVTHVNTSDLET